MGEASWNGAVFLEPQAVQEVISFDDQLLEKQQIRSLENSLETDDQIFEKRRISSLENVLETDDQLFENHARCNGYLRIDFEHAIFLKHKIAVSRWV